MHRDSLEPLKLAFGIRREHLGDRHSETLQSEFNIASAQLGLRNSEESIARFEDVLKRQKATLAENHPDITATESALAYAYVVGDEREKAIEIYKSSLKKLLRGTSKGSDDHGNITSMMSGLAYAYKVSGNNEEAAVQIERSIEYAQSNLGESHTLTLAALHLKGQVLHALGKPREAITAFESAYKGRTDVLGEMHGDTLTTANDLAVLYFHEKRYEDATDLLEEVCRLRSEKFGESHIFTRTAIWNLASMYGTVNKPAKAAATLQRVADTLSVADKLEESISVLNNLVIAYELAGDRSGAKTTYLQMAETAGIEGEELVRALRGVTHHSLGRKEYDDAFSAASRWVELTQETDPIKALICLAESQLGLSNAKEAQETLESGAKLIGDEQTAYFRHLRAIVMAEQGEMAKAESILRETYREIVDSDLTIKVSYRKEAARRRIDRFYEKWGRLEKANEWRTERDSLDEN